jgi:geranylgeranyl diphosphate synthase type I
VNLSKEITSKGRLVDDFMLELLKTCTSDEFYEILVHQAASGGKRVRPALTILSCEAAGGNSELAIPAAAGVELIHNYTLIFDDIIDRSELRRSLPTVRAKYGDVMAVLAGMHYREAVFEAAIRSPKSREIEEIFSVALKRIIEGERLDVLFEQAGRESEYIKKMRRTSISEKDYFEMVEAKTAVLFEASCKAGGLVGNGTRTQVDSLSKFGRNCGMAFQIKDDILDIVGDSGDFGKEIGKDIKEHKLGNLALLYALAELSENDRKKLTATLRSAFIRDSDVRKAIKTILLTDAIESAYKKSKSFIATAKSNLDRIPPSKAKRTLMSIADFIIERKF